MSVVRKITLILCAVVVFVYSVRVIYADFIFIYHSNVAHGVITGVSNVSPITHGYSISPSVKFKDSHGTEETVTVKMNDYLPHGPVFNDYIGKKVSVRYNKNNPQTAVVDDVSNYWFNWGVFLLLLISSGLIWVASLVNLIKNPHAS